MRRFALLILIWTYAPSDHAWAQSVFYAASFAVVLQDSKDRPAPTSKIEFGFLRDEEKSTNPTLAQFSDALLVLKEAAIARAVAAEADADMERFLRSVAAQYRQANPKPALPEAARRLKVQAELALREKDFPSAVAKFEEALEIAPWWPEGHFNVALALAGLEQHNRAILEMKRYLALVPDAADARAAQDRIYEWEVKAR